MRTFKRGDTADSRFIFIDVNTREPIDVLSPVYNIVHFESNTEFVDVPSTALTRVGLGEYLASWTIPDTAAENETYFVTASGTHPTQGTNTEIEDSYNVASAAFFSNMVVKFTKD